MGAHLLNIVKTSTVSPTGNMSLFLLYSSLNYKELIKTAMCRVKNSTFCVDMTDMYYFLRPSFLSSIVGLEIH